MNPGVIHEVVDQVASKIRSPLLIFVLALNLMMLGFIYFGVSDRRAKDHESMQTMIKECVALMERQRQ